MYNFTSINVNGLLDASSKINILSNHFNNNSIDFLFFQETHVSSLSIAKKFESKFSGKGFWSFGSNRSCGVGLIISSKLNYSISKFHFDFEGRLIVLDLNVILTILDLLIYMLPIMLVIE